ncbi:hypothetical protein N7457_005959 [Penicillium paradoxum]|uniref:uncharacterized protein n=1 Tax=Penicillium paradoxum TaxID=176176 RepID=UPI002547631A|nr:uncharacterized protein N7457_005959 [Penicillium paradoxum]KAJ5780799.1 hypothetical protein N7457_005959 [Penicillium paradoxum]
MVHYDDRDPLHEWAHRWDHLIPPLDHAKWEIIQKFGGWTHFMLHFRFTWPLDRFEMKEAMAILERLVKDYDSDPESPPRKPRDGTCNSAN